MLLFYRYRGQSSGLFNSGTRHSCREFGQNESKAHHTSSEYTNDDRLLPATIFHWLLSPRAPIQEMLVTLLLAASFIALFPFCHVRTMQAVPEVLLEPSVHTMPETRVRRISFYYLVPILSRLVTSTHIVTVL